MKNSKAGKISDAINKFEKRMIRVHKNLEAKGFQVEREDWLYGKDGGSAYFTIAICSDLEILDEPFENICGECEEWRLIRVSDHAPSHNGHGTKPDAYVSVELNSSPEKIVEWILNILN